MRGEAPRDGTLLDFEIVAVASVERRAMGLEVRRRNLTKVLAPHIEQRSLRDGKPVRRRFGLFLLCALVTDARSQLKTGGQVYSG